MNFPPESAQLEQSGQDLAFLFENGGAIILSDFFGLFDSKQLPSFSLEGGQVLSGEAFLATLREDLLPAAGPGGVGTGGGVGEYADNPGALIGGIGRLGTLGAGVTGAATLTTTEAVAALLATAEDFVATGSPVVLLEGPGTPPVLEAPAREITAPQAADPVHLNLKDYDARGKSADTQSAYLSFSEGTHELGAGAHSFADPAGHAPWSGANVRTVVSSALLTARPSLISC